MYVAIDRLSSTNEVQLLKIHYQQTFKVRLLENLMMATQESKSINYLVFSETCDKWLLYLDVEYNFY